MQNSAIQLGHWDSSLKNSRRVGQFRSTKPRPLVADNGREPGSFYWTD
jgi:hypothetical protein